MISMGPGSDKMDNILGTVCWKPTDAAKTLEMSIYQQKNAGINIHKTSHRMIHLSSTLLYSFARLSGPLLLLISVICTELSPNL